MEDIEELKEKYDNVILPNNFVNNFVNMQDFENWLRIGSKIDIKCTLKLFEKHELFEHCIIIQKVLNEFQKNEMK